MTDDLDNLFTSQLYEVDPSSQSFADRIVKEAENEMRGIRKVSEEQRLRDEEKVDLNAKMRELHKKIRLSKNVKNFRLRTVNTDLAKKRDKYRSEIEKIKQRLEEIDDEERGAGVTASTLVKASEEKVSVDAPIEGGPMDVTWGNIYG